MRAGDARPAQPVVPGCPARYDAEYERQRRGASAAEVAWVVYTPKHGSWLNMAEIEFSAMDRQCLNRRLSETDAVRKETTALGETLQRLRNPSPMAVHIRGYAHQLGSAAHMSLHNLYIKRISVCQTR